jgi:hypothetical protein
MERATGRNLHPINNLDASLERGNVERIKGWKCQIYGLPTLQVYQTGDQHVDVATLKASVVGDLYRQSQSALVDNARALRQVEKERDELRASSERLKDIPAEVHALYPSFDSLLVSEATEWQAIKGFGDGYTVVVVVRSRKPVGRADREKLEQWLRTRTKAEHARVVIDVK